MGTKDFASIETLVALKAQELALLLKARTVTYNVETETYKYFLPNEIVETFTKKELTNMVKMSILKRVKDFKKFS